MPANGLGKRVEHIKKILAIVDKPKHDQLAIRRAMALQKVTNASLHLLAFTYHPMYDHKAVFDARERHAVRDTMINERTQWLRSQVATLGGGPDVTFETLWTKDLAAAANEMVVKGKYDVVLKSAHRDKTLTHTPTDWSLLRGCPAPVFLSVQPWTGKVKILAALDLNSDDKAHQSLNRKVLAAADYTASLFNGQVHCVYAIEAPGLFANLNRSDTRKIQKKARDLAAGLLGELMTPYDIPGSRVHMQVGKVGAVVNGVAEKIGAHLLVLGTTARKGLSGLVIGNSAERVLAKARCDVLALKP